VADFKDVAGQGRGDWKGLKELRLQSTGRLRAIEKGGKDKVLGGPWKGAAPAFRNLKWVVPGEGAAIQGGSLKAAEGLPVSPRDYSFGYWKNGMRKHEDDSSKDILAIETGYYGLELDMAHLPAARFGLLSDDLDYAGALDTKGKRMDSLADAKLEIQLEMDGKVYRAVTCGAGTAKGHRRLQDTRLWESARYVQHFDVQKLKFQSLTGEPLVAKGTLDVVGWPDSLTFTAGLSPAVTYQDGPEFGVHGKGHCVVAAPKVIPHEAGMENEQFTVETWVKIPGEFFKQSWGWLLCKNQNEITEGNYGFFFNRGGVSAMMNIGGRGPENRVSLRASGHAMRPDQWHHLSLTYDGKTAAFHVDGRPSGTAVMGKKRVAGNGVLCLGQRGDRQGPVMPAVFDQIRVWNRALNRHELIGHGRNPAVIPNRNGLTYENKLESDQPVRHPVWKNAKMALRFSSEGHDWHASHAGPAEWKVGDRQQVTVNCPIPRQPDRRAGISVSVKDHPNPPVAFDPEFNCHVAKVGRFKRSFPVGYRDIRDYDEIEIAVNGSKGKSVPFLLEMKHPANITGLCPILCEADGTPTGIPVQLSKNWHEPDMGSYLRAFMLLPASVETKRYKLRIAYGFYGRLPSASHSQLSLVGYGGNGRWDQLAIGCWGETYCMDLDMSCVDIAVTDVRMLMARNGKDGTAWGWTDAGWGGDWLGLQDAKGQKHYFNGLRTAYLTHGPCLTEVRYDGYYGAGREVGLDAKVRTLRTDDFARTFTGLNYQFNRPVAADGWLFKMGRSHHYVTPKVAYGNAAGLIKEQQVPEGLKEGSPFIPDLELTGEGPWWVSFPGAYHSNDRDWGTGYRAMVIRSYKVVAGGKEYDRPVVSFPAFKPGPKGEPNADFLLRAPLGVTTFQPGDSVEIDVEWITLPRVADDYYGPNDAFRKHLEANPSSWKTAHREAVGNDLKVQVEGGTLLESYPVIVKCEQDEVRVEIEGGLGFVPIRFEGLERARGYKLVEVIDGNEVPLDQSVHGNDFWQVDYDAASGRFWRSFNLPLDGKAKSYWILRLADAGS
ncbi:MAG: LamG domain-containing protein, partial [Haloferula sp.]